MACNTYITFCIDNEYYLYDRFSNTIYLIENANAEPMPANEWLGEQLENDKLPNNPFSIPSFSISKKLSAAEKIQRKVSKKINRLCFITTEECNLRCKYCVYSGAYNAKREHNSFNRLDWKTTKKAIDFFLSVSSDSPTRTIAFYGGESLLVFPLMQKVVQYMANQNTKVTFSLNTNLTLLTPEIARFLIENGFILSISLDGPAEVHDKYRLTKNRKPTHAIVEKNLCLLRTMDETYFVKNVSFNTVIVPHEEAIETVDNYFSKDLFKNLPINAFHVLSLNSDENTFFEQYHYLDFLKRYDAYSKRIFINQHVSGINNIEQYRISYNRHIWAMKKLHFRSNKPLDQYEVYWPNSICILGMRSLLITARGLIYPCETLYDKGELSIGNVTNGIDVESIVKVTEEYIEKCNDLCRNCWAYRFCPQCFSSSYENGQYREDIRLRECEATQKAIIEDMKMYVAIVTKNPLAFEYLNEIGPDMRNPEIERDN